MGTPSALESSPSDPTVKPRLSCDSCPKTFFSVRTRHEHLLRYSHVVNETIKITVPFYLNLRQQNVKCPLCRFKSKSVKSPRSFITHFTRHLGQYSLDIAYTCTICTATMQGHEVQDHLLHHQRERIPLTPTILPPVGTPDPDKPPASPESVSSTSSCDTRSPPPNLNLVTDTISPQPPQRSPSPMPDTQHPFSPEQSSPKLLSPTDEVDHFLMRCYLDACEKSPPPPHNIRPNCLPLADTSLNICNGTPLTNNLLPVSTPPPRQTNPVIPPLMSCVVNTPIRPTAEPNQATTPVTSPANGSHTNTPPPTLEDLEEPTSSQTSPPRPTNTDTPPLSCASPISEDPSTATFPTSQTSSCLHDFRKRYLAAFNNDLPFEDFEALTTQFTAEAVELARSISSQQKPKPAPRRTDRPSARPAVDYRRPSSDDPVAARRLQHLYRVSKKRAARKIFNDNSPGFDGSLDDATRFFTETFGPRDCNIEQLKEHLTQFVPSVATDTTLFDAPTPNELSQKLKTFSNSAPGQDRLEYRHLRLIDPKCDILAALFRHCLTAQDVPSAWKTATTILIHKKDSTTDPSNFRPIALMSCLYKLLMSTLAKRITNHAINHDLLSPEQKSARPSEGCYEHAFLLESILNDARRQPRPLCLAWLDIRNAFGSIPHAALVTTLNHMGFPPNLVSMIANVYTGASTEVLTPLGKTEPIPIHSGVKQGCPLSAILFNLTLELVIRQCKATAETLPRGPLRHHGFSLAVLAYADDLVIMARNPASLQLLLDAVSESANSLNLSFRADKCASLSLNKHAPRIRLDSFQIQDHAIPVLNEEDHYRYLGVPIGLLHNISCIETLVDELTTKLDQIHLSLLAPWQKLDAIRTFVQPCLTYALRSTDPPTKSLQGYRSKLIETIRSICSLPTRATTHYIFASKRAGGLGLTDPLIENSLQTIVQAIKMLSSSDPTVAAIAKRELRQTVRFAAQSDPTPSLVSNYLSNASDQRLESIRSRTGSLWTRTRRATRQLPVTINVPDNAPPSLTAPDYDNPVNAKDSCRFLHNLCRDNAAKLLLDLRDQGKTARTMNTDRFANSSSWHFTGLNIRFKDWRFIHRARLNCLPTNSVKSRWSDADPTCRHCSEVESLPHVLCHCPPNMVAITTRHNKLVDRLTAAVRSGTITTDQTVRDSGSQVRPDIVIDDADKVTIIDVCCPFENGAESLEEAAARKELKYEHLRTHFEALGKECAVYGFVVGALGSWHPGNERVLAALNMTPRYKNLFRKLCCTDVIQGSTDIYRQHLGCDNVCP